MTDDLVGAQNRDGKTPSMKICKLQACALETQITMQSGKKWTLHLQEYARKKKKDASYYINKIIDQSVLL